MAALSLLCGAALVGGFFTANVAAAEEEVDVSGNYKAIYAQNFDNVAASTSGGDAMYQATGGGFATGNAGTYTIDTAGINGTNALKCAYTFWEDGGWQQGSAYVDGGRTAGSKEANIYRFKMSIKPFGSWSYLYVNFVQDNDSTTESVVLKPDGSYDLVKVANVGTMIEANVEYEDGVFALETYFYGTGGQLFNNYHMCATDPVSANANLDTGFYIDDYAFEQREFTVLGVYENVYAQNFDNVDASTSGGDAMYQATGGGFATSNAGGYTIDTAGINGTNALKSVYTFWEDGGWQQGNAYLDAGRTAGTNSKKVYRVQMTLKPFGSWGSLYVNFVQDNDSTTESVELKKDGTYALNKANTGTMIEANVEYASGVFTLTAYFYGTDGQFYITYHMNSTAPAQSNTNLDTGFLLDDFSFAKKTAELDGEPEPTPDYSIEGTYQTTYSQNFNSTDPSTSGSDSMYHATGFAGVNQNGTKGSLTIDPTGLNGTQSLKAVYDFYTNAATDWQIGNVYLDSGKTNNTSEKSVYRFQMKIKPFGSWRTLTIGFETPDSSKSFVYLKSDGSHSTENVGMNPILLQADVTYADGVFDVTVYTKGTGGYIFNYFYEESSNPTASNANFDTGFFLDDYSFAKKKVERLGLNKTAAFYNKATDGDFVTGSSYAAIESVAIGETLLTADEYTFNNGTLTVKGSVLKALANGTYTVTVTPAEGAASALELVVDDVYMNGVYSNDFADMPSLNGDQDANDSFFQNSWMDPGYKKIYTVDEGDNRVIKFTTAEASESINHLFQTNPQAGRLEYLYKDIWHTVSTDWKMENSNGVIGVKINIFDSGADTPWSYMEIDLLNNKRADDAAQTSNCSWTVTDKGNGWYNLSVSFRFTGENFGAKASAYVIFCAAHTQANTVYYLDNFAASSEAVPSCVGGSTLYDLASGNTPYYLVNMYRHFEIVSFFIGEKALVENTDYTVETTPVGYTRINLTETFAKDYALGDTITLSLVTSKGNTIELPMNVVNTAPALPTETLSYDKASGEKLEMQVDLKGYEVALITLNGADLVGTEYLYNANTGIFEFKSGYLGAFEAGTYVFTVKTTSGATGTITVSVFDSTPVILSESIVYEKSQGGDLVVDVNLNGKDLTLVSLGKWSLTTEEYSYEDGKLTIFAAVIAEMNAGEYTLLIQTVGTASVQITVNDAPPVFSGEYTVKQGVDLVLTVNLNGKTILSVVVDGLELKETEYSYADGKLTVAGEVLNELAVGERKVVLTTNGGVAEVTFTLQAGASTGNGGGNTVSTGCGGMLQSLPIIALGIGMIVAAKKKKED